MSLNVFSSFKILHQNDMPIINLTNSLKIINPGMGWTARRKVHTHTHTVVSNINLCYFGEGNLAAHIKSPKKMTTLLDPMILLLAMYTAIIRFSYKNLYNKNFIEIYVQGCSSQYYL